MQKLFAAAVVLLLAPTALGADTFTGEGTTSNAIAVGAAHGVANTRAIEIYAIVPEQATNVEAGDQVASAADLDIEIIAGRDLYYSRYTLNGVRTSAGVGAYLQEPTTTGVIGRAAGIGHHREGDFFLGIYPYEGNEAFTANFLSQGWVATATNKTSQATPQYGQSINDLPPVVSTPLEGAMEVTMLGKGEFLVEGDFIFSTWAITVAWTPTAGAATTHESGRDAIISAPGPAGTSDNTVGSVSQYWYHVREGAIRVRYDDTESATTYSSSLNGQVDGLSYAGSWDGSNGSVSQSKLDLKGPLDIAMWAEAPGLLGLHARGAEELHIDGQPAGLPEVGMPRVDTQVEGIGQEEDGGDLSIIPAAVANNAAPPGLSNVAVVALIISGALVGLALLLWGVTGIFSAEWQAKRIAWLVQDGKHRRAAMHATLLACRARGDLRMQLAAAEAGSLSGRRRRLQRVFLMLEGAPKAQAAGKIAQLNVKAGKADEAIRWLRQVAGLDYGVAGLLADHPMFQERVYQAALGNHPM